MGSVMPVPLVAICGTIPEVSLFSQWINQFSQVATKHHNKVWQYFKSRASASFATRAHKLSDWYGQASGTPLRTQLSPFVVRTSPNGAEPVFLIFVSLRVAAKVRPRIMGLTVQAY